MTPEHKKYHITTTTIEKAAAIEEQARQAVMQLAVDALNSHGLTQATAKGVLVGWLQISSLDLERFQIAEGLRNMAAAIEADNSQAGA